MAPQAVVMAPQIIFMQVAQIVPIPIKLEDEVDMINVLNSMSNSKSMVVMTNSLIDLLQCQLIIQHDTSYTLQVIHQS